MLAAFSGVTYIHRTQMGFHLASLNGRPPISLTEIRLIVLTLHSAKAPGEDMIPSEMFFSYVCLCINGTGNLPGWGTSIIVPLFKKGNLSDHHNYSLICLLDVVSRLYAWYFLNKLLQWDSNQSIIFEEASFRKGRIRPSPYIIIISKFTKSQNTFIFVAFMDFSSAFDLIDQECLWTNWPKQMLTNGSSASA